jgi:alpha-2-macroglobulin
MSPFSARLSSLLQRAGRTVFGRWSWEAPGWTRRAAAHGKAGDAWVRTHPRAALLGSTGFVIVFAALYWGHLWWEAQPKPVTIGAEVVAPGRTEIEAETPEGRAPKPMYLRFSDTVAPLNRVGKTVASGIDLSPAFAGEWHWESDRLLRFTPKKDWPIDEAFEVRVHKEALAPQIRLAQDRFSFRTAPFVVSLRDAGFHQDPVKPGLKKVLLHLSFSQPVDPAELEKRIELRLAGQTEGVFWGLGKETTEFSVTYDKLKLNAYVHSATLAIPSVDSSVNVRVESGVTGARGGKSSESFARVVPVPGLHSLRIPSISTEVANNEREEPEHVLVLNSSATVHEKAMQGAVRAWILPLNRPSERSRTREDPYWWPMDQITDEVLKQSTPLKLDPIAAEREYSTVHAFKFQADPRRRLYIQVEPGLRAFGGYQMAKRVASVQEVPAFPATLKILSQGSLLSLSGERKLAVMARDVPGIEVQIGRLLPEQLQHLVSQSDGDFSNPRFRGLVNGDHVVERFTQRIGLPELQRGRAHYEGVDLSQYLVRDGNEKRGVFMIEVRSWDPRTSNPSNENQTHAEHYEGDQDRGYHSAPSDQRLVVLTDLGILAKRSADGSQDVYVQSLQEGAPVSGATVEILARNGSTLFTQTTDAAGHAHFNQLRGFERERTPLMYVVRKGGDMSFLPMNRRDRLLDTSRFDVGGIESAHTAEQLNAYLFSDRGIYRPGDTIRFGSIVKAADWAKRASGVPLEAVLLDSRGLVVKKEKFTVAAAGFNELSHRTLETSPTGDYTLNLYIPGSGYAHLGSLAVKVQEFLPDRTKVSARLSAEAAEGWVHPQALKALVDVQNLFGTPAQNRKVEGTLELSPAYPDFHAYPGYAFYDPRRAKEGYSDTLGTQTTDAEGKAQFNLGLERYAKATYRLHLLARTFEPEGGRSVTAQTAALVSEAPYLIGFKPDGNLQHVSRGSDRSASLIAIDPNAKMTAVQNLNLQWIERKYVSILTKQASGAYRYESRSKETVLKESPLALAAAGHNLKLDTEAPGNFAYVMRDAQGIELNRVEYSVAGAGNVTRSLERNAELQLSLDKKDYSPGEEIEISVRAPYTGAGLITIERDKVYAQQWFKSETLASVQKIRVPKDFEGNGYVSVQFIRSLSSDEIFTSPLSYGVQPFAVNMAQRRNTLTLETPATVKPGKVLKIRLKTEKPTRAVVYAVDEGILQVARYQTPDPLAHFFQKRALQVRSAQILDLLLPEFKQLMAAAPGGDAQSALARHLNPFKRKRDVPAVWWSGIVDVKGESEFSYTVPDSFNGSLRVMAVAVNDATMGVTQTKTLVRGDFVLSPNAPLAVAPGDEFEISVGVANNVAESGKDAVVKVGLKTGAHLQIVGGAEQELKIPALNEGVALFRLKAKEGTEARLGSAALSFSAGANGKQATQTVELSVRPPTPHYTLVSAGSFEGSIEVPVQRRMHAEHRKVEAAVSPVPLVLAPLLQTYLDSFPHLCSEQLVSRALPLLVMSRRPEFGKVDPAFATERLNGVIAVLRTRQNAEGGIGLWNASVNVDELASVHAIHTFLEAKQRGIAVPPDMLQKGMDYLQRLATSPATSLEDARVRAYAAYLLTREGMVTTPILGSLREHLTKAHAKNWESDSAAVYLAASYKLLREDRLAEELIDAPFKAMGRVNVPYRYWYYYDPMIADAQALYIVSRHFPQRAKRVEARTLQAIIAPIQRGQYNTYSSAWIILAMDAYADSQSEGARGKLAIAAKDAQGKMHELAMPENIAPRVAFKPDAVALRFSGDASMPNFYGLTETGFDLTAPATELKSGLEIVREYLDAAGKPVQSAKLGEELTVKLSMRALDRDAVPSVAIVDLLPGGFEVVWETPVDVQATNQPDSRWRPQHVDMREDRVIVYAHLGRGIVEYRYRIKATNAGRFVVPPAYAESMYERTLQARSPPGRITVEKAAP